MWSLILFAFAMGVHFVVNGYGPRKDHKESYDRIGWWILAGAVLVGWVIGLASVLGKALLTHSLPDHYKGLLPINRAV